MRFAAGEFLFQFFVTDITVMPDSSTPLGDLRRFPLRTRRLLTTALQGGYRTSFRGSGLIFSDIREYQPGDDGKRIHWPATARSGTALVKSYEEERSLSIMMLVDKSQSVHFENPILSARARTFGEIIASLAMIHQDAIGLCLCSSKVEEYRKPAASRSQIHTLLARLAKTFGGAQETVDPFSGASNSSNSEYQTDLRPGIEAILSHQKKGGVVFMVSDFFVPPFEPLLRRLTHRHDTICVYLRHPFFSQIPSAGIVSFRDVESGELALIDTSSSKSRRALQQALFEHHRNVAELCSRTRADLITLDADPVDPFLSFLRDRTARIR